MLFRKDNLYRTIEKILYRVVRIAPDREKERVRFFLWVAIFLFFVVLSRLFYLQVIIGESLQAEAKKQRSANIEIAPRRGNILTKDPKTQDYIPLAINTHLFDVFIDPSVTPDKQKIAEVLGDFLFTQDEYLDCKNNLDYCPEGSVRWFENTLNEDSKIGIAPTYQEALLQYKKNILQKILPEYRTSRLIATNFDEETLRKIESLNLTGVRVKLMTLELWIETDLITPDYIIDPSWSEEMKQKKQDSLNLLRMPIARALAPYFKKEPEEILDYLAPKKVRYVPIASRVPPDVIDLIKDEKQSALKAHFKDLQRFHQEQKKGIKSPLSVLPHYWEGVGFFPHNYRHYPEGRLASQVLGFVNNEGDGQYGIEEKLNDLLKGEKGVISGQSDVNGFAVGVSGNTIQRAKDGADIVLTIDRIVQKKVEEILDAALEEYDADSGQVIVMNPKDGSILAMAGAPSFDPNFFGDVYLRRRTTEEDFGKIYKTIPIEKKDEQGKYQSVKIAEYEEAWKLTFDPEFYIFENKLGPGAYTNKSLMETYEPGSVIKPLVMAAAIDNQEINQYTQYYEHGPLEVGEFEIKNSDGKYLGAQSMTNILERSANIGMSFIADKMDKPLLYSSLKKLGFSEYVDVMLADEDPGRLLHYNKWSDAHLFTASFGQGFTASPLQVIRAWGALANGGSLVHPHIVQEIRYSNGTVDVPDIQKQQVFSEETTNIMTHMLISAVENGVAKNAQLKNYYIAGKTGTSQIARIDGPGYEDLQEDGSTIASFVGYAPVSDPDFVVLVKFDRPRIGLGRTYGSTTAAPVFAKVMEFLLQYSNATPDK